MNEKGKVKVKGKKKKHFAHISKIVSLEIMELHLLLMEALVQFVESKALIPVYLCKIIDNITIIGRDYPKHGPTL